MKTGPEIADASRVAPEAARPLFVSLSGAGRISPAGCAGISGARDCYALYYVASGRGTCCFGESAFSVGAGDALLFPPNRRARFEADAAGLWQAYWVGFGGTEAGRLAEMCGWSANRLVLPCGRDERVKELLETIADARGADDSGPCAPLGALYQMFALLLERGAPRARDPYAGYLNAAVAYIRRNLCGEALTVQAVADHVGVSRSHLYRAFASTLHQSVKQFILSLRIEKSRRLLLRTSYGVSEIAQMSGFYDAAHFSRQFKRAVNVSPLQYRKGEGNRPR